MEKGILITQCLQNDFVKPIGRFEELPNSLHIGYSEAERLFGSGVEASPINSVVEWAYETPPESLEIIHIRDWHDRFDGEQERHLEQFGEHCLQGSEGARFVFQDTVKQHSERGHIVNATGLNDFSGTTLAELLEPYRGSSCRVGLMGVWTEAKIYFLAYELSTRYPEFEIALCSALCAGSSRSMHFITLEQMQNILGIRLFSSVGDFTAFLAGSMPNCKLPEPDSRAKIELKGDEDLSSEDMTILNYLFRESKKVEISPLAGGYSGNLVLKAKGSDHYDHHQVPSVVKIGERELIAHERESFERVQEVMGNSAPSITGTVEFGSRGGIKYRYASMLQGEVETFQEFYARSESRERIDELLDEIFLDNLGRLYEAGRLERISLLDYYDFQEKYAPHVRKNVEAIMGGSAEGELLEIVPGVEVYNPCLFYERDIKRLREDLTVGMHHISYLHGDLNGRNVIIDGHENVWLIDFFHTHRGHILRDLIKFENDVQYIFTKLESEEELREAMNLTDLLLEVEDLAAPLSPNIAGRFKSPAIKKCFLTVAKLRSYYKELVKSDRSPLQLYYGLLRYSMHNLSFDESNSWQKRWALYAGSRTISLINRYYREVMRLRVDFLSLDRFKLKGKMGITILPGRRDRGRSLVTDMEELKDSGISHILCLVTTDEMEHYGIKGLVEAYHRAGFVPYHFPILDQRAVPVESAVKVFNWMEQILEEDSRLLIHCVGGLGRSGMMAAGFLTYKYKLEPAEAINIVRQARSERAVETEEQEEFVKLCLLNL